MVIFALTRNGFEEIQSVLGPLETSLWVNGEVLSQGEQARLRQDGIPLAVFTRCIDPSDREAVRDAVDTIAEHHPEERIWVERSAHLAGTASAQDTKR